jgi:alginate O-acetyltransferase complex protein AlgI
MLFNSLAFAVFFPLVTLLFYILPHRARWCLLLVASCVFYMAFIPAYILILFITILIDYTAAIYIEEAEGVVRRRLLIVSIVSTCLVLFVFKYIHFFLNNVDAFAKLIGWNYPVPVLNIILPIGLSFHTFQSLSYVIEVYRGNQKAEKHFGIYALYVMFYPQLVAGPIERPQNLLHQFREEKAFRFENLRSGLRLMAWGLFKKVVIADRLAILVNTVYAAPEKCSGPVCVFATVAFAYQIYCDFSGYSDIAIGAARVMGFKLMRNFDAPYCARSIGEFWTRWHISLSTWFRDYVYIPLGGSRVAEAQICRNLVVTFLISGLWHGANWNFVLWGGLNGLYLIIGRYTRALRVRVKERLGLAKYPSMCVGVSVLVTFMLTCLGWVLFRARGIHESGQILCSMFVGWEGMPFAGLNFSTYDIVVATVAVLVLEVVQYRQRREKTDRTRTQYPVYIRWPAYYALGTAILVFGVFEGVQFIYFQF